MKIRRTEQIYLRENDTISHMCHLSKNLYNQVNYILRQQFINKETLTTYGNLVKLFQAPLDRDEYNNYQKLPAQTAQWTIRKVVMSWHSFFKAMRAWKKHPDKFMGIPGLPGYKARDGEFLLVFTNQQCSIENGTLKFPKVTGMGVKTRLNDVKLKEVRMVPQGTGYMMEIVYEKEIADISGIKAKRVMGIDIGVRNLVTMGNNIPEKGIAVKAGLLKSINQYFNKELARYRSINDLQGNERKTTMKIRKLFMKRNRKVKDIMHKVSKSVVEYARSHNIDTIVIGHNKEWKQSANMGKRNNQYFVQLPFNMLITQIKYKAEEIGINVMIQNEDHTSKCSFLDSESIEHHDTYMGKRIKRGTFMSAKGKLIHADLQASYNIMKKAVPDAFANGIEGIGLYPRSLSINQMITSKGGC